MAFNLKNLFVKNGGAGGTPSTLIPGLKSGKARQYAVVAVLGAALYFGLYLIFATSENKPKPQSADEKKILTTHVASAGEAVDLRDRWIGTAGNKVAEHDTRLAHEEQATKDLLQRFTNIEQELQHNKATNGATAAAAQGAQNAQNAQSPGAPPATSVPPLAKLLTPVVVTPTPPATFPPATPSSVAQGHGGHGGAVTPGNVKLPPAPNGNGKAEAYSEYAESVAEIGHVHLNAKSDANSSVSATGKSIASAIGGKGEASRKSGNNFLPIGFVRSKLLGGIYAPTGGQSQGNPMPVLLRIKNLAVLPNQFRANVRDCMVVGASYGDLSAERAYVRIELLSCIRNDGQVLEVKAQGAVWDDDGKLGLRGRLISKQDKILLNALLSGVIGGIGQGIQNYSQQTQITPLGGTITTPKAGQEIQGGIGTGVGKALDRLANYQISLAEKLFPVIEVDSDREVDIAFTKGIELPVPLPEMAGLEDDE